MNKSDFETLKNKKLFYDDTLDQSDSDKTVSVFGEKGFAKESVELPWEKSTKMEEHPKKTEVIEPQPVVPDFFNDTFTKNDSIKKTLVKSKIKLLVIIVSALAVVIAVALVFVFALKPANDITVSELCDTDWRDGSGEVYKSIDFYMVGDVLYCDKKNFYDGKERTYMSFECTFDEEANRIEAGNQSFQYKDGSLYDEGNLWSYYPNE